MKWTVEQEEAINARYQNVLVSAGAGSGKTAVLTERIVKILEDDPNISINNFLVLTFTNAAAANMKQKVRDKLTKNHDYRNLALLDTAFITTFDSFSLACVERFHNILNLKPNIGVMSEELLTYLSIKYLDEIFDEYYLSDDILFKQLIKNFVIDNDRLLKKHILSIKKQIDLLVDTETFLKDADNINYQMLYERYYEFYLADINKQIDNLKLLIEEVLVLADNEDFKDKLTAFKNRINSVDDFDGEGLNFKIYNKADDEVKEVWKKLRDQFNTIKNTLKIKSYEDLIKEVTYIKDDVSIIATIILKLNQRLEQFMKDNNIFSFNVIAKMGIKLLQAFPEVAETLKHEFTEIMIDEYQDTSDLQEIFMSYIANNNVYMVGDIKQSIYRFRNANPGIFAEKYQKYLQGKGGRLINLKDNFRSRNEVIEGINDIFDGLMSEKHGGIDYQNHHRMIFGNKSYLENNQYRMKIYQYDHKKQSYLEPEIIARDIKDKINNHYQVADGKGNLRDVNYGDFAIIVQSGSKNDLYKLALTAENIPVNLIGDTKISDNNVFLSLKSMIKLVVLMNKFNNDHLKGKAFKEFFNELKYYFVSVARSFICRLDDDMITDIIRNQEFKDFPFYPKIMELATNLKEMNAYDLFSGILESFEVYTKITSIKDVDMAFTIIDKLRACAEEFVLCNLSIDEFVLLLDSVERDDFDFRMGATSAPGNAVTLINIHKSKGLEYKICYYPGLSSKFNESDLNNKFFFNQNTGIVIPYVRNRLEKETFLKELYRYEIKKADLDEKIRLLYVALTRAQEEIILFIDGNGKISEDKNFNSFIRSVDLNHVDIKVVDEIDHRQNIKIQWKELIDHQNRPLTFKNIKIDSTVINRKHISKVIKHINKGDEKKIMSLGTKIHEYLEYLDFNNPDYHLIDEQYRPYIKAFIDCGLNFKDAKAYHEYEFYTEDSHGIIDLILEYEDKLIIVDYKLSNIDDESYKNQLSVYKKYLTTLSNKKIETYLYSILKQELKALILD